MTKVQRQFNREWIVLLTKYAGKTECPYAKIKCAQHTQYSFHKVTQNGLWI